MKSPHEGVSVSILGKEFMVACPEDERARLVEAAQYLDKRMREIQQSGKVIGAERTAIMAALNIANELLDVKRRGSFSDEISTRLRSLQQRIDSALRQ